VRKRKRLLTVLAAGSAFVGGGVALGQASPSVSPAPTAAAAISSIGGGGQGLQLSTLDDHAKLLAAQIASIREQVDRSVAEHSPTERAGDPVAAQGGTQQVGLGAGTSSVASGSSSVSPATHATTGASRSLRAKGGSAAPGTHGTTGASGASTAGGSPSGGTDRNDDGGSAGMDR
jgi:hypothetical protein